MNAGNIRATRRIRGGIVGVLAVGLALTAGSTVSAAPQSGPLLRIAQAKAVTGGGTENEASRKAAADAAAADAQKSFEAAKAKAAAAQKAAAAAAAKAASAREAASKAKAAVGTGVAPTAPAAARKPAAAPTKAASKPVVKPRASKPIVDPKAKSVAKPAPRPRPVRSCLESDGPCRVFVSSTTYSGNLGGVEGADRKCLAAASAAGLSGVWRAWISCAACGPEGSPIHAKDRISNAEFRLMDGTVVAKSLDAMLGCKEDCLRAPIALTESGRPAGKEGAGRPWTGTFGDGIGKSRPNCRDWTSEDEADDGEVGMSSKLDEDWTSRSALTPCSRPASLICFEQ